MNAFWKIHKSADDFGLNWQWKMYIQKIKEKSAKIFAIVEKTYARAEFSQINVFLKYT